VAGFSQFQPELTITLRILPPDMITVFPLPPSYHFSEFSRRKRRLSRGFLTEIHGIGDRNHCPGNLQDNHQDVKQKFLYQVQDDEEKEENLNYI
jgi:hypothetical protein